MSQVQSFFTRHQRLLRFSAALYVLLLIVSHWSLPDQLIWVIATVFSIAMNFTYLTEAYSRDQAVSMEVLISVVLIAMSIIGLLTSPLVIIVAIFGHGCWDLAKHFGAGVPFFFWYTCSCFLVDTFYSAALLSYWIVSLP